MIKEILTIQKSNNNVHINHETNSKQFLNTARNWKGFFYKFYELEIYQEALSLKILWLISTRRKMSRWVWVTFKQKEQDVEKRKFPLQQ